MSRWDSWIGSVTEAYRVEKGRAESEERCGLPSDRSLTGQKQKA